MTSDEYSWTGHFEPFSGAERWTSEGAQGGIAHVFHDAFWCVSHDRHSGIGPAAPWPGKESWTEQPAAMLALGSPKRMDSFLGHGKSGSLG